MGKVVEKKKKKKGRPSLLDLQKRSLREQLQNDDPQSRNSNSYSVPNYRTAPANATPTTRRSTRRNPNPLPQSDQDVATADDEDEEDEDSVGKRREKKLKLVLRLPPQRSSLNSGSVNSTSCASDSNAEDDAVTNNHKKRKINAIGAGSGQGISEKGEKPISGTNPTNTYQGTQLDSGPSTSLPAKKLLLFILDRLQKKDTYGVFSEPVDPKELPDYHDVIEHPMDFGTVRKKLSSGVYTCLEQFEKDVFLICSNAMQYNAPDTIYFRQARSIQELAKKNFENLRQDSDDCEPEPKAVRRGRPPTKNLKKSMGRPLLDRAGSEFSSDATLATGVENSMWSQYDIRKGPVGPADSSGRVFHGSRYNEASASWLGEQKSERNDEFTGSVLKGNLMKNGRKHLVLDENRRSTYKQSHSLTGREPSVLTTFDGERKQLMAVGLHSVFGFARSLALFAANLGPAVWRIASKKIERSLPAGVQYGPGWVGEKEAVPQRLPLLPTFSPNQLSTSQPFPVPGNSCSAATPSIVESQGRKSLERHEGENSTEKRVLSTLQAPDGLLSKLPSSSVIASSSPIAVNRSSEPRPESKEAMKGMNPLAGFNILNSNVAAIRPRPPFHIHQNPLIRPGMNGVNGMYGFNLPAQMGKSVGTACSTGFGIQSSRMPDTISNFVHPMTTNNLTSEESKLSENSSTLNSSTSLPNQDCEGLATQRAVLHPQPSWRTSSPRQKPDSVPPDLNVMFQSQGSPSSGRVDSAQPDLALQL